MNWLKQALTGCDNQTIAIGRLVGLAIAVVLLIGLPIIAAITIVRKLVDVGAWSVFMGSLDLYVPAVTLAIGGLIYGTNTTEPQPKDHDNDRDFHP